MTAEGARHVYEKMAELPFDSFRKCMTVIVKDAEGVSSEYITVGKISSIRYLWVGGWPPTWQNIHGLLIVFLQGPCCKGHSALQWIGPLNARNLTQSMFTLRKQGHKRIFARKLGKQMLSLFAQKATDITHTHTYGVVGWNMLYFCCMEEYCKLLTHNISVVVSQYLSNKL